MDSLKLPTTAARAKVFMGEGSLSFPTSSAAPIDNSNIKSSNDITNNDINNLNNNNNNNNNNSNADLKSIKQEIDLNSNSNFNTTKIPDNNLSSINSKLENIDNKNNINTDNKEITEANGNTDNDNLSASGIVPTLQNIVATVNLDCRLELKTIALHARNAEYNPKRFAAVIMRIREPKTTALIFASGKMVVTGAKSEDDSKLAARKYARIIQKLGFNAKFTDFKIQNIVGSCDVKFPIRLEGLAYAHGTFSSYEPELFPGLIYRMVKPKIVLLIFVSGKIVLTGAKQREEIYKAFEAIYPVLSEFRKN